MTAKYKTHLVHDGHNAWVASQPVHELQRFGVGGMQLERKEAEQTLVPPASMTI
jgi:hypothetical protein